MCRNLLLTHSSCGVTPGTCGKKLYNTAEQDSATGKTYSVDAYFRVYCSPGDGLMDHGFFFTDNSRYQDAMKNWGNATAFAIQIAKAGYATAVTYASSLLDIMRYNNLQQFDARDYYAVK